MVARRRRLGLTTRIAVIFALGALLLTSAVATSTYLILQGELLGKASESAQAQVWRNARDIETDLTAASPAGETSDEVASEQSETIRQALENTLRTNGARVALIVEGDTPRSPSGIRSRDIPAGLKALVRAGQAGEIRYQQDGEALIGIGLWIADIQSEYYEIVPLDDVQDTLGTLRTVLVGVTIFASLLGALLGWYTARRSLQPISSVTRAAQSIAGGDFSTRIDPAIDPDLHDLSSSFNDMVDALAARIERDERFASDVSHELRSPLMTLTASVEVLERRQDELPDAAGQAVDLLSNDIRRFSTLVEDLLEISRIDAGAARLDQSTVVIAQFMEAVVRHSRSPDTRVTYKPEHEHLIANVDKTRMAQVFANLIDNAINYGGGVETISFAPTGDDEVEILVTDNGPGVAVVDRIRIFDRFTRAAADAGRRGESKGAGLGLSLAFEHVRLHGGALGVRDRFDGETGAEFYVRLPLDDDSEGEEMAW